MQNRADIGLYVHIPFCASKCGYCDFYSIVPAGDELVPFTDALLRELEASVVQPGHVVDTIFVGGGTPTSLPCELLGRIFEMLGCLARDHAVREFTVEANPATLDDHKLKILKRAGVTRVSMGAQSFDAGELAVLGRVHRPQDVQAGVRMLQAAGFEHLSLDLIFGLPGQSLESWLNSLDQAIGLGVEHLSCYGLTYEPGTPLHERLGHGRVLRADEDLEARMYQAARERLEPAGLLQYEISNYARPGRECRHNLRYWYNLPGIGVGPAAASYLEGQRWRNLPDAREYTRRVLAGESAVVDAEVLSPLARAGETAMLALRLVAGIDRRRFAHSTGYDPFRLYAEVINRNVATGLLQADGSHIRLSDAGRLVADAVISDFLSPAEPEAAS